MDDPALPPSFARDFRALVERVKVLETANRLAASSIRGGALQVLEADGDEIATIGELPGGGTGMRVRPPGQSYDHLRVDQDGVIVPAIPHSWRPGTLSAASTSSAAFFELWALYMAYPTGPDLEFTVLIEAPVGTTVEARLFRPFTSEQLGATLSLAGTGTWVNCWYRQAHGLAVRTAVGVELALQARVASGPGSATVYWPAPAHVHGLLPASPPATWTIF